MLWLVIIRDLFYMKEELGSQRDIALENITESVTDSRAMNNVFDAESDITQVIIIIMIQGTKYLNHS